VDDEIEGAALIAGDVDFFTKQEAIEIATIISMNDKQFEELQTLEREARELLKPKLARPIPASAE
jgi:hypothetical protein